MADADGDTEIFYERPLDRSPETDGYIRLTPSDKTLVSHLRSAMLGAREKFKQLRDEAEDRERDATREAALRKAAETRLDQLVDMYGDPAVMEELKQRLPRSTKTDNRGAWQRELDEMKEAAESELSPEKASKDETDARDPSRRSHSPPGANHADRPYPGYGPPPPLSAYYPPPQGYYPPPQVVYMAAPNTQGPGAAAPGAPYMIQAPAGSANQNASSGSHDPGATGSHLRAAGGSGSVPDLSTSSASAAAKDITLNREQNRQILLLLAELDAARGLNKKLQARLATTQQELESLKITSQTKEAVLQAEASGKAAAIVEEIYRAQKMRDEAMMGRLRMANEERDEAMLKLRKMETGLNQYELPEHDRHLDMDLKNLLAELNDLESNSQIDQHGRHLVDAINRQKQRKRQITTEEMKAVLEERDSAVAKCQKQEGEIIRLQRQVRGKTPEKQQQATLQAKLLTTQQERDLALGELRKMEEELQTLRVYYSLHKSLSQEANLRDQFNNTLETYQGHLKHRDTVMDQAQKENNRLLAQLKANMMEKAMVEGELSKAQNRIRALEDDKLEQEKVVGLLRERVKDMAPPIED